MPEIYFDYQLMHLSDSELVDVLPKLDKGETLSLDCEASGLYIDGDWNTQPAKCQPPARVSAVSLAWWQGDACPSCCTEVGERYGPVNCRTCQGTGLGVRTLAMPFDQGRIGGKPGRWLEHEQKFAVMPHTDDCDKAWVKQQAEMHPTCLETERKLTPDQMYLSYRQCTCAPWNFSIRGWFALMHYLEDCVRKGVRIVGHNAAKYDQTQMRKGLREVLYSPGFLRAGGNPGVDLQQGIKWDTMLPQGVWEPLHTNALKPTARRLWGEDVADEETELLAALKKNGVGLTKRYDLVHWAILGKYAAKDAELALKLDRYQQALIDEGSVEVSDVKLITEQELPLAKLLHRMEWTGIPFDADMMREEAHKMRQAIRKEEETLPFSPPNITGAKEWFFKVQNCEPIKRTDTCMHCGGNTKTRAKLEPGCFHVGAPSLDAETVARYVEDGVPGAEQWQHIADLKSALGKWFDAWPMRIGKDGRLRTNFRQMRMESDRVGGKSGGAISGRLSAERVQAQGVPRGTTLPADVKSPKKMFRAIRGYELWELDQSNAEVRVAAWLSQCEALAEVFQRGVNVHDGNTINLFGDVLMDTFPGGWAGESPYTTVVNEDGETVFKLSLHPLWEMYRTVTKTTIFGDLYNAGVRTLMAQITAATKQRFSETKIKSFKAALATAYPELSRTSRGCQRKADKTMGGCGYVRLVNGRKRWFGWGEKTYKAFNACIQGGVAETMKRWMLEIDAKYPGMLDNQVHDSVWLLIPKRALGLPHLPALRSMSASDIVADVKRMGEELFTATFSTTKVHVPFKVDAKLIHDGGE